MNEEPYVETDPTTALIEILEDEVDETLKGYTRDSALMALVLQIRALRLTIEKASQDHDQAAD